MNQSVLLDIDALRVGMFIQLDVSWINHPFPMSSFRVSSHEQIRTLRDLGVKSVRYVPAKSTFPSEPEPSVDRRNGDAQPDTGLGGSSPEHKVDAVSREHRAGAEHLRQQSASPQSCSQRYQEATTVYAAVSARAQTAPQQAREQAETLVQACVAELLAQGQCAVRLLADSLGQRSAAHAVNVMVLALLLGRSLGMSADGLHGLGLAALLHDVGKAALPAHIGEPGAMLTASDRQRYEDHVGLSVEFGQRMGLASDVLIAIAQHHEMADGNGFPLRLVAEDLSRNGQILALANRYDRLCNPLHGAQALTPHEALSQIFALQRECFDATVLGAFVRMMGVYPPGSIVQLVDGRFALVMLVDALHPLRPSVLPYEPGVPRSDAPLLDLAQRAELGILRSLKPAQLPRDALDYLLPQPRICYFFERAVSPRHCEDRP